MDKDNVEIRNEEDLKKLKEKGLHYFVFKANIPINDYMEFYDWTMSCQAKQPSGFNDYRWGKMLHDHLFVKNFKSDLVDLKESIKDLEVRIADIEKVLKLVLDELKGGYNESKTFN